MVSELRLAAAVWGKRRVVSNIPSSYVQFAMPDAWSAQAKEVWQSLCRNGYFEWKLSAPSAPSQHEDVIGKRAMDSGDVFVVRFRDAGRDNIERRHTQRIEAVLLPTEQAALADQLLSSAAWIEVTDQGTAVLRPEPLSSPPIPAHIEAGWQLFGDESAFTFKLPATLPPSLSGVPHASNVVTMKPPSSELPTERASIQQTRKPQPPSTIWKKVLFGAVILLMAVILWWPKPSSEADLRDQLKRVGEEKAHTKRDLEELQETVKRINTELGELRTGLKTEREGRKELNDKVDGERKTNADAVTDLKKKIEEINQKARSSPQPKAPFFGN